MLFYLNIVRPFAKFKYLLMIDSEIVLWRKGEKVLKFKVYKQLKL